MKPEQLFKLLAEETRLKATLLTLEEGELCVCEFVEALNVSQPKISRHLALLRNGQLLVDSRREQWVYYQINPALPEWVIQVLHQAREAYIDELTALTLQLAAMCNRPNAC